MSALTQTRVGHSGTETVAYQQCLNTTCQATYGVDEVLTACPKCGTLLDIAYDWDRVAVPGALREFEARWSTRYQPLDYSGVWRFRNLLPFAPEHKIVTIGEGQTILQAADQVGKYVGQNAGQLLLQYEGLNPSGSTLRALRPAFAASTASASTDSSTAM